MILQTLQDTCVCWKWGQATCGTRLRGRGVLKDFRAARDLKPLGSEGGLDVCVGPRNHSCHSFGLEWQRGSDWDELHPAGSTQFCIESHIFVRFETFAELLETETCCEHGLSASESTGGLEQQQLEVRAHGFSAWVHVGNSGGAVTLQWFTKHLKSCWTNQQETGSAGTTS